MKISHFTASLAALFILLIDARELKKTEPSIGPTPSFLPTTELRKKIPSTSPTPSPTHLPTTAFPTHGPTPITQAPTTYSPTASPNTHSPTRSPSSHAPSHSPLHTPSPSTFNYTSHTSMSSGVILHVIFLIVCVI